MSAAGDGKVIAGEMRWNRADGEPRLLRTFISAIDPTYSFNPGFLVDEDSQEIVERLRERHYFSETTTADLMVRLSLPRIVAHNADFDIRFIWQRVVVLGARVPTWWPINVPTFKQDRVFCTMQAWAGTGKTIGLDRLCTALGLPGKQGFDGSQAWDAVRDGRVNEVIEYNCGDVERLRSVFRKLTFAPPVTEIAA